MKTRILKIATTILLALTIMPFYNLNTATAANSCNNVCTCNVPQSVRDAAGCSNSTPDALQSTITNILDAIIGALGIVAVIFIVIGGINYMTSNGDSNKLKKAKDTILYACIGLAICALAFVIVNFAIGIINSSSAQTNNIP